MFTSLIAGRMYAAADRSLPAELTPCFPRGTYFKESELRDALIDFCQINAKLKLTFGKI